MAVLFERISHDVKLKDAVSGISRCSENASKNLSGVGGDLTGNNGAIDPFVYFYIFSVDFVFRFKKVFCKNVWTYDGKFEWTCS